MFSSPATMAGLRSPSSRDRLLPHSMLGAGPLGPQRWRLTLCLALCLSGALIGVSVLSYGRGRAAVQASATQVFRRLSDCSTAASGDLSSLVHKLLTDPPASAGPAAVAAAGGALGPGEAAAGGGGSASPSTGPRPPQHLYLERLGYDLEADVRQQVFCEEAFPILDANAEREGGGGAGGGVFVWELTEAGEAAGGAVQIYVYAGDDEVSSKIREGKGWEAAELNEILWALRQPIPAAARAAARAEAAAAAYLATTAATDGLIQLPPALRRAAASSAADGAAALYVDAAAARSGSGGGAGGGRRQLHEEPAAASGDAATASTTAPQVGVTTDAATDAAKPLPSPPPLFVDVGANVGWFSINAAAAGFRVAAFEGMSSNVALVRSSVCASPGLGGRLRLHALGLGAAPTTCFLFSDVNNQGDGITMCGVASEAEAAAKVPRGYALRGALPIRRLDAVLHRDTEVQVLKVDVEGYEPHVLSGAAGLSRVWYVAAEYNPVLLRGVNAEGAGPEGYRPGKLLDQLVASGYRLSTTGFKGPWLTAQDIKNLSEATEHIVTLYGAHRDLFLEAAGAKAAEAAVGAAAGATAGSSGSR